ncbi:CLUMA_CG014517, isoform A [Clunio marinus]|uniref:CLUMA_CG014517, isoform A n=1 Tax=Clunio marinus TaxID=568069 RepID=A0A1J1IMG4_9DIPT|nr:CLUMA_CG014517, isoform A [Clunio marinus]
MYLYVEALRNNQYQYLCQYFTSNERLIQTTPYVIIKSRTAHKGTIILADAFEGNGRIGKWK